MEKTDNAKDETNEGERDANNEDREIYRKTENRHDMYRRMINGRKKREEEKKIVASINALVIGDSIIRGAGEVCRSEGCEVQVFPGIRVNELEMKIIDRDDSLPEPSVVVAHVGTNNLKRRSRVHLMVEINQLLDSGMAKYPGAKWIVGGLLSRKDMHIETIKKLNESIEWLCAEKGVKYYDPNSTLTIHDVARDGVHPNHQGGLKLGHDIMEQVHDLLSKN